MLENQAVLINKQQSTQPGAVENLASHSQLQQEIPTKPISHKPPLSRASNEERRKKDEKRQRGLGLVGFCKDQHDPKSQTKAPKEFFVCVSLDSNTMCTSDKPAVMHLV